MFKGLLLSLFVLVGLFLFSNIDKGIEIVSPDQVLIHPLTNVPLKSVLSSYPDTKIVSLQEEIVQVPYGKVDEYLTRFQNDPKIQSSSSVSIPATFDFSKYAVELEKQAVLYAHGDMGAIEFHKVIVPIGPKIGQLILNSLSYLIPGLFLGILSGYMIAVLATWKPKIGQVLDKFHQLLLGIPDFFVLVLLQLAAIQLAKSTGHKVLTVFQFGDDVPFLIPLISISLLPGVLLYGTLRLAVEREWDAPYISTAYSKGIQRTKILFIHILRNTTADVLSILPRVIAVGITSLVVAEVMSGIFGLGGYALNPDITKVTSLGVTCAIFALFALVMHFLISWFGQTFTFKHEGGTLTNRPQLFKKRDRFRFQFSFVLLLLLTFVVVFGSHLMPHHITKDAMLQFQNLTVNGQVKIVSPPFPPSSTFWLGTDHRGYDILSLLLNGAKYTFGFALIVTVLRFAVAL
ncbi:MAG: ABC transporter permease subunit, partial [Tumebacillaceae bacterium]